MFDKLRVPTLAVVENLAYIDAPPAPRIFPFGEPGKHMSELRAKVPSCKAASSELPLSQAVGGANESGTPLTLADPAHPDAKRFHELAATVVRGDYREAFARAEAPSVVWNEKRGGVRVGEQATSRQPPATSHQPPATNHQPPATSHQPPATSHQPPATSHQAPATRV